MALKSVGIVTYVSVGCIHGLKFEVIYPCSSQPVFSFSARNSVSICRAESKNVEVMSSQEWNFDVEDYNFCPVTDLESMSSYLIAVTMISPKL